MRSAVCAAMVLAGVLSCAQGWTSSPRAPLSVRDLIESTRAMTDPGGEAVFVSPSGARYAVMLIRGDVARDGVWAEVRVGELYTAERAAPRIVASLFTRGLGHGELRNQGSDDLVHPGRNPLRWLDENRITLLWEDAAEIRQVVSIDVDSGRLSYLTDHRSDVLHFAHHASGTLVYGAAEPCVATPSAQQRRDGYVVKAVDAFELLSGCGAWGRSRSALFVASRDSAMARQVEFSGGDTISRMGSSYAPAVIDPTGRWALYATTLSEIPEHWREYRDPHFLGMLNSLRDGAHSPYAMQFRQLFIVDLARASARALWDAPQEPYYRMRTSWAPDGRSVALGPTFLPIQQANEGGLTAQAAAVVELTTGDVTALPLTASESASISSISWCGAKCVAIRRADAATVFRKRGAGWTRSEADAPASRERFSPFVVELKQGSNDPPQLMLREVEGGASTVLLDLNPDLRSRFALGHVEWRERPRADGSFWAGRLFYPADYEPERRYPLVVQTHSLAPRDEFTLTGRRGHGLGPGISVYLAQLLAGRGVFVLHGRVRGFDEASSYLEQTRIDIAENQAWIEELAASGKVDRTRVGVMGYSATGWDVSYALTHSEFPYAAAITDDNKDGSYLQAALSSWVWASTEEMIGAPPFGDGLKDWLAHSPAMNAHRVRTPLLLTRATAGSALSPWEMFSRLRWLKKPAEYYVIPEVERGRHGLQNPRQLMALQERALDWWLFWLKHEEDPSPAKAQQYAEWRELRELQRAVRVEAPATP